MAVEKEVQLRISTLTEGGDKIRDLAKEVDELAKTGGEAAPAFQKLSTELDKLAAQQDAIGALEKLRTEVADTSIAFGTASSKAEQLSLALKDQAQATQQFREQQAAVKAALQQTADQLKLQQAELNLYKKSSDDATKGTVEYDARVKELSLSIAQLGKTKAEQSIKEKDVSAALKESEAALKAASAAYNRASTDAAGLNKELSGQTTLLEGVVSATKNVGVETENLVAAQRAATEGAAKLVAISTELTSANEAAAASTLALAKAEQELQAQLQFEAETGRRLIQIDLDRAAAEEKLAQATLEQAAAQEKAAAVLQKALGNAFAETGVRSMEVLRAEALAVEKSLLLIKQQFESGAVSAESFSRAVAGSKVRLAELQAEASTLPSLPGVFERISASVSGVISRFVGLGAAVGIFGLAVKPVFDLAIQIDTLRRSLTTVTGSAAEAENQIAFLRNTANQSGVAVKDISDSFVRFTASMKSSGISAAETQRLFASVTNAAGNLGLSSDKVSHILDALGQMANKGVVSMEELRQQLGDSLPGALSLMAKGLGITEQSLIKMVTSGQLLASSALPALATALTTLGSKGKEVEGLQASFNRLKNAIDVTYQRATDSSAFKQLSVIIDSLAHNFTTVVDVTVKFGEVLLALKLVGAIQNFLGFGNAAQIAARDITSATAATVSNSAATIENTLATGANTTAKAANSAINKAALADLGAGTTAIVAATAGAKAAATNVGLVSGAMGLLGTAARGLVGILGGPIGLLTTFAFVAKDLGVAIGESIAKLGPAGAAMKRYEDALKTSQAAAKAAADAQQVLGDVWVQSTDRYTRALLPIAANIQASEKLVQAKKLEGESMVRIATLSGSEASALQASSNAAAANEAATNKVATARQQEVDALRLHIQELQAVETATVKLTTAQKTEIEKLNQKLQVQDAALTQEKAAVESAHSHTVVTQLATQAFKDNSTNLAELKQAYENTATASAIMRQAVAAGAATQKDATKSAEAAAIAQSLYKDALADSVQQAERQKASSEVFSRLVGENAASLKLAADAAQNYADKVGLTTKMYQDQSAALKQNLADIIEDIKVHGDATGALKEQANVLREQITLKDTEATRSRQSAQASKDEAEARRLASEMYKDNSSKLGELMSAAHAAAAELQRLTQLQKEGKATAEEVADATRKAASAEALYADALKDTTTKLQNKILLDKAMATQTGANLKLKGEEIKTEEALAKAKGDEIGVTNAQIKAKQNEAEVRRASASSMREEADSTIRLAEQERLELEQTGKLTPEKRAEIDARIANAEAKRTEAAATDESVKQIDVEIDALKKLAAAKNGSTTSGNATGTASAPQGTAFGEPEWATTAAKVLFNSQNGVDPGSKDTLFFLQQVKEDHDRLSSLSNGQMSPLTSAAYSNLKQAIDILKNTSSSNPGAGSLGTANSTSVSNASTSHTVTIKLGTQSTTIATASPADSQALTGLLSQLGSDMSRTL